MDVVDSIQNFTIKHRAALTSDLLFIGDARTITILILLYLYMCVFGPRLMRDRKEINVKAIMQVYNIFMIVINAYIINELVATTITDTNWFCDPVDFRKTPRNIRHARGLYIYYFTKLIEFADTLFFIVRKKFSHVSFLHVYHHASMSWVMWVIATFTPTADCFVPILANCVVHIIMYIYYFVAALGPKYTKYLWWKKHLTKIQIIQFFFILFKEANALYVACNPGYEFVHIFMIVYMVTFVILFTQFYLASYLKKSNNKVK